MKRLGSGLAISNNLRFGGEPIESPVDLVNLCPGPIAGASGGWTNNIAGEPVTVSTVTISTPGGSNTATKSERTSTSASAFTLNILQVGANGSMLAVAPNTMYTVSCQALQNVDGHARVVVRQRTGTTTIGDVNGEWTTLTADVWGRCWVTFTTTATTDNVIIFGHVIRSSGVSMAGDIAHIAEAMMTLGSALHPWFSGDIPPRNDYLSGWQGAVNQSQSEAAPLRSRDVQVANLLPVPVASSPRAHSTTWGSNNGTLYTMNVGSAEARVGGSGVSAEGKTTAAGAGAGTLVISFYGCGTTNLTGVGRDNLKCKVTAGKQYTYSLYVKTGIVDVPTQLALRIQFSTAAASSTLLSEISADPITLSGDWARYSWTFTAPATAAYMALGSSRINLVGRNSIENDTVWFADAMLNEGSEALPWVSGTYADPNTFDRARWVAGVNQSPSTARKPYPPGSVRLKNLATNPSPIDDGTAISWLSTDGGRWPRTAMTGGVALFTRSDVGAGTSNTILGATSIGQLRVSGNARPAYSEPTISPGSEYTLSAYVECSRTARAAMQALWLDSSFNTIGSLIDGSLVDLSANTRARVYSTFTAPAGAMYLYNRVRVAMPIGEFIAGGETTKIDSAMITEGSTLRPWFSGDDKGPYSKSSWVGTPNGAVSVATMNSGVLPSG